MRIVVGVDGSEGSHHALEWAVREGKRRGATVVAVHAWHWAQSADAEEAERGLLDEAVDKVDADIVERVLVFGATATALVEAARDAELLVVGTRGRGELTSAVLGSVSHEVARRAPCPVVIVPPGGSAART